MSLLYLVPLGEIRTAIAGVDVEGKTGFYRVFYFLAGTSCRSRLLQSLADRKLAACGILAALAIASGFACLGFSAGLAPKHPKFTRVGTEVVLWSLVPATACIATAGGLVILEFAVDAIW
jgi:hypothetical protein